MLQLLYILAFTVLAVLAVSNLIRNLVNLGIEARRPSGSSSSRRSSSSRPVPHPELLDDTGQVINEPLLVMRSVSIKDARDQLDAMYDASGADDNDEQ